MTRSRKPRKAAAAPAPDAARRCLWCGLQLDTDDHALSTHPACRASLIRPDRRAERVTPPTPDSASGEISDAT